MSEDPTKNLEQRYDTRPILENLLSEVRGGFERVERRLDAFENPIDRVESVALATRAELLDLRADFREFRAEMREHFKTPA